MSVIKDIVEKEDPAKQKTAEIKEALNLLYQLSKQKADIFAEQIAKDLRNAGTTENRTVPITVILGNHQEIRAITKDTPDGDITKGIGNALKQVLTRSKDDIIDGLTALIDTGLKAILGVGEGEERQEHTYYVATEGMSIVRLDLIYWCRCITASGITAYAEKSIVCTAVKSSVDVAKIDFNAFLAAYQAQLVRCKFNDDQLKEELKNAREIYKMLTDNNDNLQGNQFAEIEKFGVLESITNKATGIWPPKQV